MTYEEFKKIENYASEEAERKVSSWFWAESLKIDKNTKKILTAFDRNPDHIFDCSCCGKKSASWSKKRKVCLECSIKQESLKIIKTLEKKESKSVCLRCGKRHQISFVNQIPSFKKGMCDMCKMAKSGNIGKSAEMFFKISEMAKSIQ